MSNNESSEILFGVISITVDNLFTGEATVNVDSKSTTRNEDETYVFTLCPRCCIVTLNSLHFPFANIIERFKFESVPMRLR